MLKNLNFKAGAKASTTKKGTRKAKTPKGLKVHFNENTAKLYVIIEEQQYSILNNIFRDGAQGTIPLYSIPIANNMSEPWTLKNDIDAEIIFDRYEKLNPFWSSVKIGSRVEGKIINKTLKHFEITNIIKV